MVYFFTTSSRSIIATATETALNKEASIKILVPKADDIYSQKIADTFEEAIDNVVDALTKQLQKKKEKSSNK